MVMAIFSRFLAIKKDGNRISIEFTIIPLRNETGELVGLIAIIARCDQTLRGNPRAEAESSGRAAKDSQDAADGTET